MSTTFKKQQMLGVRVLPRGFTLVELLVVIGIIGILTSLASVAMFRGLTAAKQARTAAEVTQLAGAIEQFKLKFGDYPPSFLDHSDLNSRAMMKRFLAKAFPRCNPDVEIWYIPWCDDTNSYYPYLDTMGSLNVWDPANASQSGTKKPMSAAQALVFWLTSISKDPAHPLSAPTADRNSFLDFDNGRISRLNSTQSLTNSVSGSGWAVLTGSFSPPTWTAGPTAVSAGNYPKYNVGTYAPRDGSRQAYVYFEARCYLFHAMFLSNTYPPTATSSNPPPLNNPPVPYLSQTTPWDTNSNGVLDAGDPTMAIHDVPVSSTNVMLPVSFTTFQSLCVNPKSFQIISAGADNDFGLANFSGTNATAPITQCRNLTYNPNSTSTVQVDIYYKSYPDGQGYDIIENGDDDNITNFSESPLGNAKSR